MAVDYVALRDAVMTIAASTGQFLSVGAHEPTNAPTDANIGFTAHVIYNGTSPILSSGLASSSVRVEWIVRIMINAFADPRDLVDISLAGAADALVQAIMLNYDLDVPGVRCIDVRGMDGEPVRIMPGYLDISGTKFRIADVYVPILINDAWDEAA